MGTGIAGMDEKPGLCSAKRSAYSKVLWRLRSPLSDFPCFRQTRILTPRGGARPTTSPSGPRPPASPLEGDRRGDHFGEGDSSAVPRLLLVPVRSRFQ